MKSGGGKATPVNVTVVNETNANIEVEDTADGVKAAVDQIRGGIVRGCNATSEAFQNAFGLKRRGA